MAKWPCFPTLCPVSAWCMDRPVAWEAGPTSESRASLDLGIPAVPFKLNQDRRHHIPRQQHKVTNWPAYEAGLRQRGSLTVWFKRRRARGLGSGAAQDARWSALYSPLAILTALTLRAAFRLAYRQTEGLIGSIISLLGLTLRVPDHTTPSRP